MKRANQRPLAHLGQGVLILTLAIFGWPGLAEAADPELKDMFADRVHVTGDRGSARGSTVTATVEPREPRHGGKPGGHSVWLSWTAPATGIATVETSGSGFDTLLSVYVLETPDPAKPPLERLKEVAQADDDGPGLTSTVQFGVQAGTAYEIAVDGFRGAVGDVRLRWDLLASAQPPPVILQVPPDRALRVGDTVTLTVDFLAGDGVNLAWLFNGEDRLGNETGTLTIPDFQAANVGRYQLRLTAGAVRMTSAPIELQVNSEGEISTLARDKLLDALDSGLVGSGTVPSPPSMASDVRGSRALRRAGIGVTRGYNGTQIFNTLYASKEAGEPAHCGQAGGGSYWLAYQAPADGLLTLDTEGSSFDTVLAVYTYESPLLGYESLISLACDDNGGALGTASQVVLETSIGRTYFVVVDGVNGARGVAHLNYRLQGPPRPTPPSIVTAPASQAVSEGQPAAFVVEAAGSAPLQYQWLKDGAAIPGATASTFALASVVVSDAGLYGVRVSGAGGQVVSPGAQLAVGVVIGLTRMGSSNACTLQMPAFPGMPYQLESASRLQRDGWVVMASGIAESNRLALAVQILPEAEGRFYRITRPPIPSTSPGPSGLGVPR